jgi:hypothetical protein
MKNLPPFEIKVDRGAGMLTATLRGFWDLPTAIAYCEGLGEAAGRLALDPRPRWLIDLGALEVQSGEITAHIAGAVEELTARYRPIVAIVLSRALVAVQTRRVANRADHHFFPTRDEAQAWLAAEREAALNAGDRLG